MCGDLRGPLAARALLDNSAERFRFRTGIRNRPAPQERHEFLQKVVFVPVVHRDSDNADSILFQSIRRPFWRCDFTASMERPVRADVSS
jgi:hypothetical protein